MTRTKHMRKSSHKKWNRSVVIMVSMVLLLCVTIGGTIAFLIDGTDEVKNTFTPSKVITEVDETIVDTDIDEKTNVKIKNTGDTEAYIRAAVIVTWQDKDGNVYGTVPVDKTDYEIVWYDESDDIADNWLKGSDGFYYYQNPVSFGESTSVLFIDCVLKTDAQVPAEGYFLNVEIISSGIQSKSVAAVEAWSNDLYTIGQDNKLTAKQQGGT